MRGSIVKRGAGYSIIYRAPDPATGKTRQTWKGGYSTKRAAEAALKEIVAAVDAGGYTKPSRATLAGFLRDEWLPVQRGRGIRASTVSQYEWVVEHCIVPHLGGHQLSLLRASHVQGLYDTLRTSGSTRPGGGGVSARTVQLTATVLRMALAHAVRHGLISRNPADLVDRPRVEHREADFWTDEESATFLAETAGDRLYACWLMLLTLGPRRGELAGLRWENVDLDAGRARLIHTRVTVQGTVTTSGPKTNAGRRSVPLGDDLVAVLRSHKVHQSEERLRAGAAWGDSGYVFVDELGRPYSPEYLTKRFRRLATGAGLRPVRLHGGRHTAATGMLADGTPTKVAQEILGHSSPAITMALYQHVVPGMADEAVGRRAARLRSANGPQR